MSAETATAKRVTRTLRASPVKERTPIPRADVENMSAVTLAALGISSTTKQRDVHAAATTPQASDRAYKRMSKTSSEMYATPPSTVMPVKSRTVSSSSHVSGNNNNNSHNSSSRTRDRTTTSSSIASSDARNGQVHAHAPLTAIRRPAPQSHQNTTPAGSRSVSSSNNALSAGRAVSGSMKASPSSMKLGTNGSNSAIRTRKTSNNSSIAVSNNNNTIRDTLTSIRSRAPSSDASRDLQREEEQQDKIKEKGVFVTQEEYSSLVALLSAKDEQIESLKEQVDENRKELSGLKERNIKLLKEKEVLIIEKKDLLKIATATSSNSRNTGKDGSNSPASQGEDGSVSKKEYESFKKQYEMQENLLEGFQRENEKATIELEALKKRDKYLTEQLKKIYGPSFSVDNELNPNTPDQGGPLKRFPSNLIGNGLGHGAGSPLNGGMFIGETQRRRSECGSLPTVSKGSPLNGEDDAAVTQAQDEESTDVEEEKRRNIVMEVEPAILMEQLVSVQSLLERFEKRLLVRESELIKKEREAVEQMERLQIVIAAV